MTLPTSDPATREPRAYGDDLHARGCPVVRGGGEEIVVAGHREAHRVATDPQTFGSGVSRFLQIPNGLDGVEHRTFRALIERYLAPVVIGEFAGGFRAVARGVVGEYLTDNTAHVDAVGDLGDTFAVRAMLVWLGWDPALEERLLAWVKSNNDAQRSGQDQRNASVAAEFDAIISTAVQPFLDGASTGDSENVTEQLIHDTSLGRKLTRDEVISILRNWTGGDLSSMSYCIGVVLKALADNPPIQERLRFGVGDAEFVAIIDELLRQDSPFVSNRRVTSCPVSIGGVELPEGQRVRIHWTAANRDPRVFGDPDAYAPEGNAERNLVWGAGPHYCPGKALAMTEMKSFLTELLAAATVWNRDQDALAEGEAQRETHPVGGWRSLPITLDRILG